MAISARFEEIIGNINKALVVPTQWDGFWIHSFRRGTLVVYSSHDQIYGADHVLAFKKVIFFNIPERWRDSNVDDEALLRLATEEEFASNYPGFATGPQHMILAIDMHLEIIRDTFTEVDGESQRHINRTWEAFTFFIVAEHVFLLAGGYREYNTLPEYEDTITDDVYPMPSMKNRVVRN